MKRISYLSLLLLLPLMSMSQTPTAVSDSLVLDSMVSFYGTEHRRAALEVYAYDAERRVARVEITIFLGGDNIRHDGLQEFVYDTNNRQTICIYYNWRDNQWQKSSRSVYSYDENQQLVSHLHQFVNLNGEPVSNNHREEYTYDDAGHVLSYQYYLASGAAWKLVTTAEYTYDEADHLAEIVYIDVQDGSNWYQSKYAYSYDEQGLKTREDYFINVGTDSSVLWRPSTSNDYSYEDGRISEVLTYYYAGGVEQILQYTHVYHYGPFRMPSGLDNISKPIAMPKVLRDGRVLIVTPSGVYDCQGLRVE